MFDEFKHSIGGFFREQSEDLLHKQLSISHAVYNERTGRLNQFLGGPARVDENAMQVTVTYPLYIRFLDMKRAAIKTQTADKTVIRGGRKVLKKVRQGKKKTNYTPIYNKYVYGYLKAATVRRLRSVLPSFMIREFTSRSTR